MPSIGFIGLGHMGLPMAINLVKAGYEVSGFDLEEEALKLFSQAGGIAVSDQKELIKDKDIFITMLQTGEQVEAVCLGSGGIYPLAKGSLHIDCSTIDVETTRNLRKQAEKNKIMTVDAPVSGGVAGAVAASLTFMVGGNLEAFEKAKPLLTAMGKQIFHTGKSGSGQAAKICNNMILGISMVAISESFLLAEKLGLSAQTLFEVVSKSSGQCWAMSNYVPVAGVLPNVPANNYYEPGFSAAMMLKDLLLAQKAAAKTGIETPLGQHAMEIYKKLREKGVSHLDFSSVFLLLRNTELNDLV